MPRLTRGPIGWIVALVGTLGLLGASSPAERARTLHRWAEEALPLSDPESRTRVGRWIDEAIELEPAEGSHWRLRARLRELQGYDREAMLAYRRATELSPLDPACWRGLGGAEKRLYLHSLDGAHLAAAIEALERAAQLRPHGAEAWLQLVPLRYEAGDVAGAVLAARRALAGRPRRVEAPIAAAYTAHRIGEWELADSLFRAGIPRLPHELRSLFSGPQRAPADTSGWATPAEPPERPERRAPVSPPVALRAEDPDPTTAANEALLEWWSRVAHAVLLFDDPLRPELDARADTYIRYGPPQEVVLNPAGVPLYFRPNSSTPDPQGSLAEYPLRAQLWVYPELGMRVLLHDRSLRGYWTQPVQRGPEWPNAPSPQVLAARPDLISLGNGHVVIPTLAPRAQRLEVRGSLARFLGANGPRLRGQLDVSASPADTLVAEWVVRDDRGREVARASGKPGVSACDPAGNRVAEFMAELAPGTYDVTLSVRGPRRRGFVRRSIRVDAPPPGVAMGDLVVNCGPPSLFVAGGAVRLEATAGNAFRRGAELAVYMEIHRLASGADGISRFEYDWSVTRASEGWKPDPLLVWASRAESLRGSTRRQFVAVNTAGLAAGRYRIHVRARDLVSGTSTTGSTEFRLE